MPSRKTRPARLLVGVLVAAAVASSVVLGGGAATAADRSPAGRLDEAVSASPGSVSVRGWAVDPDLRGAVTVRVVVDGTKRASVTANASRPDVGRARPADGPMHGVVATVTGVAAGTRSVCLVAANVGPGSDRQLGCRSVTVAKPVATAAPKPAPTPSPTPSRSPVSPNPLAAGQSRPSWSAAVEAQSAARAAGRTGVAAELDAIAGQPSAIWLGDWMDDATLVRQLGADVATARRQGRMPVFVLYAIPQRDCGLHSAGGFTDPRYRQWSSLVATTLKGTGAVVVVEPDALALLGDCPGQGDRTGLLKHAVDALADAGVAAYLDAGTSQWVDPTVMAKRLKAAGVDRARGFSTNVSNYRTTAEERAYAEKVRAALGGKARYVIDTSRNGRGWQGDWCNPSGVALGTTPRAVSDGTGLDALLWIKRPGESDGTCNGGPSAGTFSEALALGLIRGR